MPEIFTDCPIDDRTPPEVHLWRAVLNFGLRDIKRPMRLDDCAREITKRRSNRWLRTQDFETVCDLAGIEPCIVRGWVGNQGIRI